MVHKIERRESRAPPMPSWLRALQLICLIRGAVAPGAITEMQRPSDSCRSTPLRSVSRFLLAGASAQAITAAARHKPRPPLRSILGQREEATLVDEQAPSAVKLALRAIVLGLIFLPVLLGAPLALLSVQFRQQLFYSLIKGALARAGTAFIKWGQWASCRPDMFPERLCACLSELHSQVGRVIPPPNVLPMSGVTLSRMRRHQEPGAQCSCTQRMFQLTFPTLYLQAPTHSFKHTQREVETAMGRPISECFESIETKPIASGSIAQIHRATLDGQTVAVKVRNRLGRDGSRLSWPWCSWRASALGV